MEPDPYPAAFCYVNGIAWPGTRRAHPGRRHLALFAILPSRGPASASPPEQVMGRVRAAADRICAGHPVRHWLSHTPLGYVVTVLTGVTMSGGRGA